MKDYLDSIKDYFSQRATNPFLATILFVWTFRNWRLVYGLFTFDEKATQADKLAYIENYFANYGFYQNLGLSILYAFGALIATYILLGASRYIVDLFEKRAYPKVRKLNDKNSIVDRLEYESALKIVEELRNDLNNERANRIKAQGELKSLEETIVQLTVEANKVPTLMATNEALSNKESIYQETLRELGEVKRINEHLDTERINAKKAYQALQQIHHKEKESLTAEFRDQTMQIESNYVEQINKLTKERDNAHGRLQEIANNNRGFGVPPVATPRTSSGLNSSKN